jgi:hypothetical protein
MAAAIQLGRWNALSVLDAAEFGQRVEKKREEGG